MSEGRPDSSPAGRKNDLPDRADFDPEYDPEAPIHCELCGTQMYYTGACKIQCPNCGYKRDCSDP